LKKRLKKKLKKKLKNFLENKTSENKDNNNNTWTDEDLSVLEACALACNPEMLKDLIDVEIPRIRAIKALIETGNKSIEKAVKWLEIHDDDPNIDGPIKLVQETEEEKKIRIEKDLEKVKQLKEKKKLDKEKKQREEEVEKEKKKKIRRKNT